MGTFALDALRRLTSVFESNRDPARARPMAAYMRDRFPFLGIPTPQRRRITREALKGIGRPSEAELGELAGHLWEMAEREYQYTGVDILIANVRVCGPGFLATARALITTKSWWDTVDALASRVVGPLVVANPGLIETMDRWIESENVWLTRTAILHQLGFKKRTDCRRLFDYCLRRSSDTEFFIRKAIGWALREYSKTDAEAVRTFVETHESQLSGLSRREALLWLDGGRKKARHL
jgi:3-methyladenine DNA glycosylase AlkD